MREAVVRVMVARRVIPVVALLLAAISAAGWLAPAAFGDTALVEPQRAQVRFAPSGGLVVSLRKKRQKTTAVVRLGAGGHLDQRFAGDGTLGPFQSRSASSMTLAPKGRILLVTRGEKEFFLRRYLASGRPDRSFGSGSGATVIPSHPTLSWPDSIRVFFEPSGEILVTYHTTQTQCYPNDPGAICDYAAEYLKVHRYSEAGRLMARRAFYGEYWEFGDAAQTPEGDLVVVGAYHEGGTTLLRLTSTLKNLGYRYLQPSEEEKESGYFFLPKALALLPDRSIVVSPKYESTIRRYRADGTPFEGFGDHGAVDCPGSVRLLNGLDGGGVLAAGGTGACGLVRYRPEGSPDPAFGAGGFVDLEALDLPQPESLTLGPAGRIAVAGWDASRKATVVSLFTSRGDLDLRFGDGGSAVLPGRLLSD